MNGTKSCGTGFNGTISDDGGGGGRGGYKGTRGVKSISGIVMRHQKKPSSPNLKGLCFEKAPLPNSGGREKKSSVKYCKTNKFPDRFDLPT